MTKQLRTLLRWWPHKTQELTTNQWKQVIDQLHQIGVFILTFTGGEPTLREDLPELLEYSQNKGFICSDMK